MLASRRAYALSRLRVVHVGSWAWRLRAAVAPPHYVTLDVMTTYDTIKLYAYDSVVALFLVSFPVATVALVCTVNERYVTVRTMGFESAILGPKHVRNRRYSDFWRACMRTEQQSIRCGRE